MSSLYGYLPNLVQQQTPPKPAVIDTSNHDRSEITATTPAKVPPAFESGASSQANTQHGKDPNLSAQSKVAANDQPPDTDLTPADLADQHAQDLARARQHASEYKEYKARIESVETSSAPRLDEDGQAVPRMDKRVPLLDEMPDRPVPRLGVPTV